ncbi:MAG: hypothetical protein QF582_17245 [Alphaproteobacteria bacterium]|jgi:virginiamycin B lyase|nr:hypothetical protein [Alphaproteobacteria bacterium]
MPSRSARPPYRITAASLVVLSALLAWGGVFGAAAGPAVIEEIVLPDHISAPFSIAVDAKGKVWFAEKVGRTLNVYDPEAERFASHPLPVDWGKVGPARIAFAPDGRVWFSVRRWAEDLADTDFLGTFDPAAGKFAQHRLEVPPNAASGAGDRASVQPEDMVVDRHGIIWFLAPDDNKVYRFDAAAGQLRGFPIPTPHSYPRGIAIDQKGVIWFVEANVDQIAKFVPDAGAFGEYPIPTKFSSPAKTAVDGQGRIWFVEMSVNRLGVFYPDLERFDEALVPTPNSLPNAVAVDDDDKVWFLEYRGNKIGMFDPLKARFREFTIPTYSSEPGDMAIDHARGRLWFSEANTEVRRLGTLSLAAALAAPRSNIAQAAPAPEGAGLAFPPNLALFGGLAGLLIVVAAGGFLFLTRGKSAE